MTKSLKSTAANYGLYLAIILSSFTIIGYAVYLDLFTKWWLGISQMIIVIIIGIMSSLNARKNAGGLISFKDAFTAFFVTVALGITISALLGMIIFNYIDSDAATVLQDKIIETQTTMMENFGAPQESIDLAREQMEAEENFFSISNTFKSIAYQLLGFSLIGLIVAAVTKKKDPNLA